MKQNNQSVQETELYLQYNQSLRQTVQSDANESFFWTDSFWWTE